MDKPCDILIVGSSNIAWGIEPKYIQAKTGLKTRAIAIAGGDVKFRFHVIREYLRKHKSRPPKLIIFHTDKYILDRNRYTSDSYRPLQGYYHKNILKEYIAEHWTTADQKILNRLFRLYTLNSQFYFIMAKQFDSISYIVSIPYEYIETEIRELVSSSAGADGGEKKGIGEAGESGGGIRINIWKEKSTKEKIKKWREMYAELDRKQKIDAEYLNVFKKTAELLRNAGIDVLLLETPVFNFTEEKGDNFDNIRKIFRGQAGGKIRYEYLARERFENDISLFADASHVNMKGRLEYSKAVARYIEDEFLRDK